MSACYGRSEDLVFSGAANGDVYIWKDTALIKTIKAHDGPVFAMCSLDKVAAGTAQSSNSHLEFILREFEQSYRKCHVTTIVLL